MHARNKRLWSKLAALCGLIAVPGLMLACSWSVAVNPDELEGTLEALAAQNEELVERMDQQATWMAHVSTRVGAPIATSYWILGPTPTPWVMEPTPPVSGYVQIEEGRCCVGGPAGSTVEVRVSFWATSPFADVTDMRTRTGALSYNEIELADAPWEPYVQGRIFPVTVAINWTGFYVSVQFRDALGNLSPVYTDDISVEGMPPLTLTPYPPPGG